MPGFPSNAAKPPSGSWLDRWLQARRPHPQSFLCGVRVVDGAIAGERTRWRYRDSAIDPHGEGRIVLNHGPDVTLRLDEASLQPGVRTRPGDVVLLSVDVTTGATVQLSVPLGEAAAFGVEV
jgi:hypothetical protein